MTATDELRRMLDERGVKHYDGVECTYWGDTVLARRDGSYPIYRFSATEVVDGVSVHLLRVSPEQAIEATLGRGTCEVESIHGYTDPYTTTRYVVELSCHTLDDWPESEPPAYCPWCGAKVVGE